VISQGPAWRGTGGLDPAARLAEIARAVGRLIPDRRDPEKFFETRSELAHELRRLARTLDHA
jgi:hypothetical protein